jgi:hypothetical protein
MSIYYTGFYLNKVPTGFGFSTGVALVNSGNSPIEYRIKISDTTLTGITASDVDGGLNPNKTIFISESLDNDASDDNYLIQKINQNDSGVFYILHKPFSNYSLSPPNGKHTGHETARITIESVSSLGDVDEDILIDISGQRIFIQPQPKTIGKFYAVTDYKPDSKVNIQYNWSVIDSESYLTGFRIETSLNSSFTNPLFSTDTLEIKTNINENDPLYGKYDSFKGEDYNFTLTNLEINQAYYARISGLNVDSSGSRTFVTGFTVYNPVLDGTAYSGLTPSPGSDLVFTPRVLYLDKISDSEVDFDLFKFLYENNNNSVNFTKYSGVVVNFLPQQKDFAIYKASSAKKGAINFIVPVDKDLIFSVNANNIFTIQLEFENIGLYGFGGEGGNIVNGTQVNPKNGGPVLNIDNIEYADGKKVNYYIYKDADSIFMAGAAGGQAWLITDNTDKNNRQIIIPGSRVDHLTDLDLTYINP